MSECIQERGGTWHLAGPYVDSWFRPILCDDEEGIIAPGPTYEREPTCPDCLDHARRQSVASSEGSGGPET